MATLQNFDAEIAKTKQVVEEMRSKIEQSGTVLDKIARTDAKIGASDFDIENARIEDVIRQQKVMEGNIADLIIGLEDATNVFGTEFESMKSFTGWESFIGIFSAQSKQRMRTERVRNMSLAGNLQELLSKSDTIVGILKAQKQVLEQRYATSEASLAQVIERRKSTIENLTGVQKRIEELNPMLLGHREQDRRLDRPDAAHRSLRASAPSSPPNTTRSRPRSRSCWPRARRWNATPRCSRPSWIR